MGKLHESIKNLSPEQRDLLMLQLKKQKERESETDKRSISRYKRESNIFPISLAQQRIWFLNQLEGESVEYNIPMSFHLSGPLQETVLEQAINEVVERHEALRTTFAIVDGLPVQKIASSLRIPIKNINIQPLPDDELSVEVKRLAKVEANLPFDLTKGPLIRATILALGRDEHVLLLTVHHIVFDGWSIGVFFRELSILYNAFIKGKSSPIPELQIQYVDFALWQEQYLRDDVMKTQIDYWKQHLAGAPPLLELPTDRQRSSTRKFPVGAETFKLNPELAMKIKNLSHQTGNTLFMILFAAFTILLSKYSNREDIVIGTATANRSHKETELLIGFFVNTIVLRIDLSGNPSFIELLDQVRKTVYEAYDNQDVPFQRLVEELHPERDLHYTPVFQVMFAMQNVSKGGLDLSNLTVKHLKLNRAVPGTNYDLTLSMEERKSEITGVVEFNADLFDVSTIARMTDHFQILLEGILNNPEQSISRFPLLTKDEQQQLLVWNKTVTDYPKDQTIVDLFQAQVEKTPENIAVVFEGQAISYQALNTKANQLAHYLMTLGVGAETLVGICVERSLEMVIGLLGILKAGGAYVPFDPEYPLSRLQLMLEDSSVTVLLSQSHLLERLPASQENGAKVVCLDSEREQIAAGSGENPVRRSGPENLVYVIYTSGSTGIPKGVMVEHRNVLAMLYGFEQVAPVIYPLRGISVCPFSFDLSVWEFFINLCFGGTLHLVDLELLVHPTNFADYLFSKRINCTYIPPALLEQVVNELERRPFEVTLQRLLIGVEPIKQEIMQRYRDLLPKLNIINGYGPTETTICATFYPFIQEDKSECQIPIGKPVQGYQIYLMDSSLQPRPLCIPGELCIAGAGLARGYLNRPELTAEKFIEIEVFGKPRRLYKTGDLARWLPDGNLEYLGRMDNQVKLRGYRIELGEIEANLAKHTGVNQVVALAREDEPNNKRLVAYIVPENGSKPTTNELRDFLTKTLPEYMIPSVFVMLDSIPLTPNGKVDRKSLPAPDQSRPELVKEFVAPGTLVEIKLAEIWGQILNLNEIGINDNFFDLGGHSLLATQVISRIGDTFQVELPLRLVFESPCIAEIALKIEKIKEKAGENEELGRLLDELEGLSDEEAQKFLDNKME